MDKPRLTTRPPFTTRILEHHADGSTKHERELLPATQRDRDNDIVVTSTNLKFLEADLLVPKLEKIQHLLWVCGWLMPPRPLHHQLLLSREIVISEDPNMHLVWYDNYIILKPLPLYLLEPDFWTRHILGGYEDEEHSEGSHLDTSSDAARLRKVASCARGLLFSYTALIAYKSDFHIARDRHLIPDEIKWEDWQRFTSEFLQQHQQQQNHHGIENRRGGASGGGGGSSYASYHPRYWYGELRLSRLNKVYIATGIDVLRGYSRVSSHVFYGSLLSARFTALATVAGYAVLVLTAMQVGLGVDRLAASDRFQQACFGFTVFAIVAPLGAGFGILVGVLPMVVENFVATRKREKDRFESMGVEPEWRNTDKRKRGKGRVKEKPRDVSSL